MIINHVSREMGARRLSIRGLADRAGLSYGAVFDLYHAKSTRIDLDTIDKLCSALGVGVGDLFEYRPDPA